jgi:hypothetical protein
LLHLVSKSICNVGSHAGARVCTNYNTAFVTRCNQRSTFNLNQRLQEQEQQHNINCEHKLKRFSNYNGRVQNTRTMADREDARRLSSLYHIDDDASSQAAAEIDGSEASDSEEELYRHMSHQSMTLLLLSPVLL